MPSLRLVILSTHIGCNAALAIVAFCTFAAALRPALAEGDESLPFKIVSEESLKKGGSIDPLVRPKYVLIRSDVTLLVAPTGELSDTTLRATLDVILSLLRAKHNPDAVSVQLFQSEEHVGSAQPLASLEWWPKGHSLGPANVANISDKESYIPEYRRISRPEVSFKEAQGLTEDQRRRIYKALVLSEDRAQAEADRAVPLDPSHVPLERLREWAALQSKRNLSEYKRLVHKYRHEVLSKFKITEAQLQEIMIEANAENWPSPP